MNGWVHIGGFRGGLRFLTAKRSLLGVPALPKAGLASRRWALRGAEALALLAVRREGTALRGGAEAGALRPVRWGGVRGFEGGGHAVRRGGGVLLGGGVQEVDVGAAMGAADGLGVVAAVLGVVVFFGAAGAHGEGFHGGAAAVVGGGFLDGEAGAAVCAVDEGVEVAGVLWVVEFAGAVVAGGDVGGDVDGTLLVLAFDDLEVVEMGGIVGEVFGAEGEDDGAGGGILLDGAEEIFAGGGGALGVDFDVGAFVGDGAVEAVAAGEVGDEGAEADALDDAGDGGADEGHDERSFRGRGGLFVVGSGGGFAPTRSAANLPSRVCGGSWGGDGAVFMGAWLVFSAPLGCSPLRSLSQSPRPPEGGPVARGGAEAVASLPVRWGWHGAARWRRRSCCSLSAWGSTALRGRGGGSARFARCPPGWGGRRCGGSLLEA